jgi:hypothetical protein
VVRHETAFGHSIRGLGQRPLGDHDNLFEMPHNSPGKSHPRQQALISVLLVAVFCLFWAIQGLPALENAIRHDFLNLYTGSSLAKEARFSEIHDRQAQLSRERELMPGTVDLVPFVRPHFYAGLLIPLSLLPYQTAFWWWIALQTALLIGCFVWAWRRFGPDAAILGSLYFPTAVGISNGQDCVLLLVIVIGAYVLHERGFLFWGGSVLALGLMKFHLFLLVPFALLLQKRWRTLAGFSAAASVASGLSFVLAGYAGVQSYIGLLLAKDLSRLSPAPEKMLNVQSIALNLGVENTLPAALTVVVLALLVVSLWKAPFWRALAAALASSLLVAPHVYAYDAALLLLPLWLVIFLSKQRLSRVCAAALLIPLPYLSFLFGSPWTALPAVTLFCFLLALATESYRESRLSPPPPTPTGML